MLKKLNSDYLGLISSTLCLIHCIALPFIVVFFGEALHSIEHLEFLDWIFAVISLYAAYDSIKKTSSNYLKLSFIIGWVFFLIGIVFHEDVIFSYSLHIGSLVLIASHLINYKLFRQNSCEIKYEK
jgi:hypothetical protein